MTYRVIQWATGGVGRAAIQGIADHPELELVGCWVHSEDKVGQDAGTIAGTDALGVAAPDLRRQPVLLGGTVRVVHLEDDGHHEAARVLDLHYVEVRIEVEQVAVLHEQRVRLVVGAGEDARDLLVHLLRPLLAVLLARDEVTAEEHVAVVEPARLATVEDAATPVALGTQ